MVAFLALRILYVVALVCFVFVPWFLFLGFSPPESLPGTRFAPRAEDGRNDAGWDG